MSQKRLRLILLQLLVSWRIITCPKLYMLTSCAIAAAAARINAQIQAKKGVQHVDVPPIRSVRYHYPTHVMRKLLTGLLQTLSPTGGKTASPGPSTSATGTVNGEMYIADGDYIRDIEVNDLRNRYTLTKSSTQKMVNTPYVAIPLIFQTLVQSSNSTLFSFSRYCQSCGRLQAYSSAIARTTKTSVASADLRCVTSRSKKKPALVRYTYTLTLLRIFMLTFEDVTTRGNYVPDKSMATAAVSYLCWFPFEIHECKLILNLEPASIPPCNEHD